ncbi:hypothetical protein L596_023049 [Steinernema carpocapsae]|uniref:G-protein coupled receptors family 1 profile domain-containing protein n=1 Tax=Steinernema carpocapsae TaxID=34508 RepID=A0A4U5MCF8_STECR|nr:hypothetical protein L596_023049 [Steinernema carpocapsae]
MENDTTTTTPMPTETTEAVTVATNTLAVSNEFVFASATPTLFMCSLYMVLGVLAMFCSSLNITIFLTNNELRKKYMFYMALDVGEFINGLSYLLTSIGRGSGVLMGTFPLPISFHDCFFRRYWVHSLIIGTELPALITIVISIERILAVQKPKLYSRYVTPNTKIMSLVCVAMIQLVFLGLAGYSAYGNHELSNTRHCAIITSTSTFYSTFHFTFDVCAYVISFTSLMVIYVIHRRIKKNSQNSYGSKKNPQLGLFLSVTGSAIILVAMPGFVMVGIRWKFLAPSDIVVALTYATTGFLSVTNTVLNFIFREEYRNQLKYFLGLRKTGDNTTVFHVSKMSKANSQTVTLKTTNANVVKVMKVSRKIT